MWHYSKKVLYTYVWQTTQTAYAYIDGMAWFKIKPGAADGVTNLNVLLTAAAASGKLVHVYIDGSSEIAGAMLL